MIFILERSVTASQKIYLKAISLFRTFSLILQMMFVSPEDISSQDFLLSLLLIVSVVSECLCYISCWTIYAFVTIGLFVEPSSSYNTRQHQVLTTPNAGMLQKQLTSISPLQLNATLTAGPSWAAEGNKSVTRLLKISLYYAEVAQVLTPFILLLPAWGKKAISNLSQVTAAENCHLTCISPHVPLPPHNPLFEALPAISTRTNWNFWWWRSKDLANIPIKKQGKNVYLKYFW